MKDKNDGLDPKIVALIAVICIIVSAIDFVLYYCLGRQVASYITCFAFFIVLAVVYAIKARKGSQSNKDT